MGPKFWERWSKDIRAAHRTILLTYLQVFPPLFAAVGGILMISAIFSPGMSDRANMIAIGALAFVAGVAVTAVVLYVCMLSRRLRPPQGGPKR
jgi:hypothetical protein